MKIRLLSLLIISGTVLPALAGDDVQTKYQAEARKTAQEFMQKLGGVLKQQLEAGGPESAVGVCKQVAPALAAEYSRDGRVVKRVSLKPRNQIQGVPDAWETQRLQNFDRALSEGKPVGEMEFAAVTEGPDGRWFRYVKAIPTQKMCLQCHGQPYQISEGVKALLAREYPEDQATGYSAGSVRGAISMRWKLD